MKKRKKNKRKEKLHQENPDFSWGWLLVMLIILAGWKQSEKDSEKIKIKKEFEETRMSFFE